MQSITVVFQTREKERGGEESIIPMLLLPMQTRLKCLCYYEGMIGSTDIFHYAIVRGQLFQRVKMQYESIF